MPSPHLIDSRLAPPICLCLAVGTLGATLMVADWSAVLLELFGMVLTSIAVYFWCHLRVRRRAEESFEKLAEMAQSPVPILPAMPDEWPQAAAAAQAVRDRLAKLEESMGQNAFQVGLLSSFLESLPEGVIATDSSERLVILNGAARRLLGLSEADFTGRQLAEVVRVPALHQVAGEARRKRQSAVRELRLGERASRVLNAHSAPVPGESGGVVILLTDITFLSRTEEFRRDFVSNVSHELRTPVTSIQGYAETLLDTPDLDERTRHKFIEVISRQAVRLNHIIEDILELSRLEHDATGFVFEEAPLFPILQSSLETCTARATEKKITLRLNAPTALKADINASLLEQALTNLVTNAVKYSPESREVLVTASQSGGKILISVKDNGIGIAPEHLPRLFERFYRVDKARSRSVGGTGLGLAIVRQVALLHLGTVSVSSVSGQGSVFTLELPEKRPPDQ